MAIINGTITIGASSTVVSSSKAILSGSVAIDGKSSLSIFWLELSASSQLRIESSIIQRLSSATINGVSSLSAAIVKVGREYFRKTTLKGEAIYYTTLEGGGSEYMILDQDIHMSSGDYLEIKVSVRDETGGLKDISGSTFQWTMGNITKTNGDGITITSPINGEITIVLSPDDTINLFGKYPHQVRMIDAQNHPTIILKGLVRVDR